MKYWHISIDDVVNLDDHEVPDRQAAEAEAKRRFKLWLDNGTIQLDVDEEELRDGEA